VLPNEPQPAKDYKVHEETTKVAGLLTGSGVRFIFTSFVRNFQEFSAVALILVVMIGVGLSEEAGLIAALVRKLVAVSPPSTLAFIIVLIGVISSIASDAGYLVLIPLGAAAYLSVGRHPLAGIAAGFAGVSAGFGVNFLITPIDTVLTEITNEAIHLVDPHKSIDLTANLYFGIGSTILVAVVGAIITTRIVERRLGKYDPSEAGETKAQEGEELKITPEAETRGLRWALYGFDRRDRRDHAADGDPRSAVAQPRDRQCDRRLAVHGQPRVHDHAHLLRLRLRLRAGRGDDQRQHGGDQRGHEAVGLVGGLAAPVPADRSVFSPTSTTATSPQCWR
jgi:AbgT putative transporter family